MRILAWDTETFPFGAGRMAPPIVCSSWRVQGEAQAAKTMAAWLPAHWDQIRGWLEAAARNWAGKVAFAKLNTEQAPQASGQYGIRSIPTLILFRGGREIARKSGAMPAAQLAAWLNSELG